MKNYIFILSILAFFIQACDQEDALSPSLADEDRAIAYADMSKPLVKGLIDDFNCGLLYEYDENLDFRYTAENISEAQAWEGMELPSIKEDRFTDRDGNPIESFEYIMNFPDRSITVNTYEEHVDAALNFMDTTLFKYFQNGSFIADLFPNKVLISSQLVAGGNLNLSALTEGDSRVSSSLARKALRSVYNRNSVVLNGSMKDIAPDYIKYKKDNFYAFIIRMMDMHNLYERFPNELFTDVEQFYGDTIGVVYGATPPYRTSPIIPNAWYHELGFIDTQYFTKQEVRYSYDSSTRTWINPVIGSSSGFGTSRRIYPKHMFPSDRNQEIRGFLNELIHRTAEGDSKTVGLENLPEIVKQRLRIAADEFISWGIDLKAMNPGVEALYN